MTFTIIARNPHLGQIGVGIASGSDNCFGGSLYLAPEAGIVSIQGKGEPKTGARALDLLRTRLKTSEIVNALQAEDSQLDLRQILIAPVSGKTAALTGGYCGAQAGDIVGPEFVIAGNMLASEDVLPAMKAAYFADMHAHMRRRLLMALEAGMRAGGDRRGHRSAGIAVLGYQAYEKIVTDSQNPLGELREG